MLNKKQLGIVMLIAAAPILLLPLLTITGNVVRELTSLTIATNVTNSFVDEIATINAILSGSNIEGFDCKFICEACGLEKDLVNIGGGYHTATETFTIPGEYYYIINCTNGIIIEPKENTFNVVHKTEIEVIQGFALKNEPFFVDVDFKYFDDSYADGICNMDVNGDNFELNQTGLIYRANLSFDNYGNYPYQINCSVDDAPLRIVYGDIIVNNTFVLKQSLTGVSFSSLAWADINNNGWWDLIYSGQNVTNYGGMTIEKYINNQGTLIKDETFTLDKISRGSLSFGDINNNGYLDLIITGATSITDNIFKYYKNNNGQFILNQSFEGIQFSSTALIDLNRDGKLDLVSAGTTGDDSDNGITKYHIQNEQSNFITYNPSKDYSFGSILNINNQDLLITGFPTDYNLISNIYDLDFNTKQNIIGVWHSSVAIADFTNNGKPEIVIAGFYTLDYTDYSFTITNVYSKIDNEYIENQPLIPSAKSSMAVGDYNNDGWIDLVVIDGNNVIFYKNQEGVLVEDGSYELPSFESGSIAFFDYNNNGALDLAISGGGMTRIYENQYHHLKPNEAPEPPKDHFSNTFNDVWLNLGWGNGSDDTTPENSLYYNIRVGTLPEGNDIISGKYGGSSNPTQGYLGNMMQLQEYSVNVTENRTYFWQVQTIDAGLRASEWSTIQIYDACPHNSGDWIITNNCTRYNETNISNNIYVDSNLTLINTNLTANTFSINGDLILINSNITADNIIINGSINSNNSKFYGDVSINTNSEDLFVDGKLRLDNSNLIVKNSIVNQLENNGTNNSLVNVSYTNFNIISGEYYRKWYIDIYPVDSTTLSNLTNVEIIAYNNLDEITEQVVANNKATLELIEYINSGTKQYYTNYMITANRQYYLTSNKEINFTNNDFFVIELEPTTEPIIDYNIFNDSTNFDGLDHSNVEDAFIGITNIGKIEWLENITASGVNFSTAINISNNNITVNSVPGINKSARLTLFGLSYLETPLILKNNNICSECSNINYENGIISFQVNGFSSYTTVKNAYLDLINITNKKNNKIVPNENVYFEVRYRNFTNNPIAGADCNVTIFNSTDNWVFNLIDNGNMYNASTTFTDLDVNSYFKNYTINCSSFGNELNVL
ncbi:MAG: FG-GAP repeat domain-containing protein, partial [Candidatus Woesearchaeota archaeon]